MIRDKDNLGMAMLILAESVFFFMLLLAFIYFRGQSLKTASATLSLPLTSIYTVCLLASGFTLSRRWMIPTLLLGLIFTAGQIGEYVRLTRNGVTISQGLFGTTFFTLAGMHAVHVAIGLLLIGLVAIGKLPFAPIAMFWYFVAAVWVAVFLVVYLWTFA